MSPVKQPIQPRRWDSSPTYAVGLVRLQDTKPLSAGVRALGEVLVSAFAYRPGGGMQEALTLSHL